LKAFFDKPSIPFLDIPQDCPNIQPVIFTKVVLLKLLLGFGFGMIILALL
jgi:hypothetical protein